MKPPNFAYHRPGSTDEAVSLLGRLGDEAKVLAGGQSLLATLNLRLAHPANLVDINRLDGSPSQISSPDGGGLSFGAVVRQRAAESSSLVRERSPLLAEALPFIGHPQIRNRGTVCGSLAHADPASELPAVVLALDGELVARSQARGARTIKAADFFRGYLTTALEPDELLVELRLPAWPAGAGGGPPRR
jgi:carbon-monoxide dehydrogenase medium subunit